MAVKAREKWTRRAAATITVALALAGTATARAEADPVLREPVRVMLLWPCTTVNTSLGTAAVSVRLAPRPSAEISVSEGEGGEPGTVATGTFDVTWDGRMVTGSGVLLDAQTSEPLGVTELTLEVRETAEERVGFRWRDGNQVFRTTGTSGTLHATGTLTVLGQTAAISCTGTDDDLVEWTSQPDADIGRSEQRSIECDLTAPDGSRLLLSGDSSQIGLYVLDADEYLVLVGFAHRDDGSLIGRRGIDAVLNVEQPDGLDDIALVADVRHVGERTTMTQVFPDGRATLTSQALEYSGELRVPGGAVFDLGGCTGTWEAYRSEFRSPGA